jgi:hypothetical protein
MEMLGAIGIRQMEHKLAENGLEVEGTSLVIVVSSPR